MGTSILDQKDTGGKLTKLTWPGCAPLLTS